MVRIGKWGIIAIGIGTVAASSGTANAASAGETCKLAVAQMLYRPSTDFRSVTLTEAKGRVTFESSFDQSVRSIECETQGDRLTWWVADEKWRRKRDTPADDRITILKSGIPTVTREHSPLSKWGSDFDVSPQAVTYLVKLIMNEGVGQTQALSWVSSVIGVLSKTGGNADQAFNCSYWGGRLLKNEAINYEVMKLDIEECVPAGINAVAVGAGVTDAEIIRMMLSNRLASKNSLLQLSAVVNLRADVGQQTYSDYFANRDKVNYP